MKVLAFLVFALSASSLVFSQTEKEAEWRKKIELAKLLSNNSAPKPNIRTPEESREMVSRIHFKVFDVVKRICRQEEISEKNCTWNARVERKAGFQAYAFNVNEIVIHSGLIDKTTYEDEVAFVVAHEIGHHLFRHVAKKRNAVFIGALLGSITELGLGTGVFAAALVSQATSVERERVADWIATRIITDAGYDLSRARSVLVRMAKMDGRSKTKFLASHPAALERLMAFDQLVASL